MTATPAPLPPDQEERLRQAMLEALPRVRRFAYALTGSRVDGDDLVQAVCERALARLYQFQPGTRMDSWLFRITQRLWVERHRAERLRRPAADLDQVGDVVGEDGRKVVEARLILERVRRVVAQLPHEQRSVLALVSVDGRSYRETADSLGIPIGTVMSRLARARRRIADALSDEPGPTGSGRPRKDP
jgi:RNA polymerase sigma-70 factor (ECF subfamily)